MDSIPKGFTAYKRRWKGHMVLDTPGPGSAEAYYARGDLLAAISRLLPAMIREFRDSFFELQHPPKEALRPSDANPHNTPVRPRGLSASMMRRLRPRVRRFLARWNIDQPWMRECAWSTLHAWTRNGFCEPRLESGWSYSGDVQKGDLPELDSAPNLFPWDPMITTEDELRSSFEAHVEARKLEAFLSGFVPRPATEGARAKVGWRARSEMLALYLVGAMSYEKIADWFQVERGITLHHGTVAENIKEEAGLTGIELPPRRGRRKQAATRSSAQKF